MVLIKNISEILFLISMIFVLYKLFWFLRDYKLPVVRTFLITIALNNLLFFLVFLWSFLKNNNNLNSIRFIFDTITYFVEFSVPLALIVFIYLIFNRTLPKLHVKHVLLPAILVLLPKVVAWLEIIILKTSYILNNLYTAADLLFIISIIIASIYLRYRTSQLSGKKIKTSLNILSLIFLFPYIIAFILTIIFSSLKLSFEIIGVINPWLIILFNLGIALWIYKYKQIFAQHFVESESKTNSELEKFLSIHEITARESEVIKLVCKGKTNKEIADLLFISINTVKDHNYKIYQKLKIKNRTQLMKMVFEY